MKTEKNSACESTQPITEDITIPKYRFDEINGKYKVLKNEYLILEEENKKKDKQIKELMKDIDQLKSDIRQKYLSLTLREVFVDGGLKKEEYEAIVNRISCPTEEETILLAKEIVKLVCKTREN